MPEPRPNDLLPVLLPDSVRAALLAPMVDQHCCGVRRDDTTRSGFEQLIGEGGTPAPPGTTHFDTPAGLAIRRWCAPVLGLEPHAPATVYLSRRAELGAAEVNRRLLRGAGVSAFLVDTGLDAPATLTPSEMGRLGAAAADEIVRLEQVEQDVAEAGVPAADYAGLLRDELAARAARAAALTSVAAHRCGLGFDPSRPSRGTVIAAAGRRLADPKSRLDDPVLVRHLLWAAVDVARERALPLQFHCGVSGVGAGATGPGSSGPGFGGTGFGGPGFGGAGQADAGVAGHLGDPARLTGFVRALAPLGVPVVLLHCYPYHRQAAYLASVFPHVYVDAGPAVAHTAAGSAQVLRELLEIVPFHKQMYGSGCHGVAELCFLAALCHRRGLARVLADRIAEGEWSPADAARIAHMIGAGNARRVYRL
ncbi:amidohydrolase [Microbispora rosea subsp. aerata]|nr:amidohydrolase family protein [Microbispora rosea]GGO10317.1 amidohydrolase [Microbispora rosea subsp. aerata]GIH53745.1 amidohydrolase [Microbispora rosea subsp. aerata]GLJ81738.1 amidohydrolase [Microbispora rosea subsp. aerata]